MRLSRVIALMFSLSLPLLAKIGDLYSKELVDYKGVDILNFYIPVEEQNKYRTTIDYENGKDIDTIIWNVGEGYLELGKTWELEYDIERKFYRTDIENYRGWNNIFSFVNGREETNFLGRVWDRTLVFGVEQETLEESTFDFERYKIFAGYRFRTPIDIGMGGTYLGFDILGKKVFSTIEDGWAGEINLVSSTALGYGFQLFNTIYNEYISYDRGEGYRLGVESYLRWTYELSLDFAFAVELGMDMDRYFGDVTQDYNTEVYIYPHLLYSHNFTDRFRVFGEIGLPSYKLKESKAELYNSSEDGIYYYGKIGLEYIF